MARRSNRSILKEISPEYSLEGLVMKLKIQYFGHLMWRTDSLEKTLMLRKIEGRRRRGGQRERWHYQLNGHQFKQAPAVGDGQGGLACCSPWACKESDTTERLNWTEQCAMFWEQIPCLQLIYNLVKDTNKQPPPHTHTHKLKYTVVSTVKEVLIQKAQSRDP